MLEFGFKTLFLSQIILCILFYLFPDFFIQSFANIVILTVEKVQLWRLISSILLPGVSMYAFLNVLFQFYVMYMFLPDIVIMLPLRKKSSPLPLSFSKY